MISFAQSDNRPGLAPVRSGSEGRCATELGYWKATIGSPSCVSAQAMGAVVREASEADAPVATEVLRRSISALCVADHHNDPTHLDAWLRNKTVVNVVAWIRSRDNYCVVASIDDDTVCGFGAMTVKGEIILCYVDPNARFRSISFAMLDALEGRAKLLGVEEVHLDGSTVTARGFYEERGYVAVGATYQAFEAISCQPMAKRLAL